MDYRRKGAICGAVRSVERCCLAPSYDVGLMMVKSPKQRQHEHANLWVVTTLFRWPPNLIAENPVG